MNLEAVREVKRYLLQTVRVFTEDHRPPFAVGVRLTDTPGDYRLAILLTYEADYEVLRQPAVREVLTHVSGLYDVEVTGEVHVMRAARSRPGPGLMSGASVGHHSGGGGTLGFFAQRLSDSAKGFVSCNHVLARVDRGAHDDEIISPSRAAGGSKADVVALLDGNYPRLLTGEVCHVDAAFAALTGDRFAREAWSAAGEQSSAGAVLDPNALTRVSKAGSASGLRHGLLSTVEVDGFELFYGLKTVTFDDMLVVKSEPGKHRFSEAGDSGSYVYETGTNAPVGLLFAHNQLGDAFVNPMRHVTKLLGVRMIAAP